MTFESNIRPIQWTGDHVKLIDQTKLPYKYETVDIRSWQEMADAIKNMIVRGAPAIGVSGAFGLALAAREFLICENREEFIKNIETAAESLKTTRPTAVNLMWAVDKQLDIIKSVDGSPAEMTRKLEDNALEMLNDDIEINKKIGEHGAKIVHRGATVLTHCNAGALATAGYGTALGVIRSAFAQDPTIKVFANETRPRQQGARLTTWELVNDGIPVTLVTDGMCGYFMKKGLIDVVITGGDRIAANGDTANKIGTYTVALVARAHNIPFYVAAPYSSIDLAIKSGDEIEIEERNASEITNINGESICPEGVNVINPAFDITPAEYITGIITETGIYTPIELEKSIKENIRN